MEMHQNVEELSKRKKRRTTNVKNDRDGNKPTESRQVLADGKMVMR